MEANLPIVFSCLEIHSTVGQVDWLRKCQSRETGTEKPSGYFPSDIPTVPLYYSIPTTTMPFLFPTTIIYSSYSTPFLFRTNTTTTLPTAAAATTNTTTTTSLLSDLYDRLTDGAGGRHAAVHPDKRQLSGFAAGGRHLRRVTDSEVDRVFQDRSVRVLWRLPGQLSAGYVL